MFKVGLLVLAIGASLQSILICRPLKEDEAYVLKMNRTVTAGDKKLITDEVWEHRCQQIDDHGIEHIEAKCLEGTSKSGDSDAESTKGETYNYFQNSRGQRFEYEEIRVNLKEDPFLYVDAEIHSKLKDYSVVPDEKWTDRSANTVYLITAGKVKKFMNTDCIQVTRKGEFTNGIVGEFKVESWFRVSDGQLMSETTTADHVTIPDAPELTLFEKLEFRPEKT